MALRPAAAPGAPATGPKAHGFGEACVRPTPATPSQENKGHSLPAGAHLIQDGAGEVELGEGAAEAIWHICPAAEEDQGVGIIVQGPQEHFDEGLLLGTEDGCWLGFLLRQALKSPSWPSLEPWVPPPQATVLFHAKA